MTALESLTTCDFRLGHAAQPRRTAARAFRRRAPGEGTGALLFALNLFLLLAPITCSRQRVKR